MDSSSANGLQMFPAVMSFCIRVKLGGQGYRPDLAHPLHEHRDRLSAICSCIERLQIQMSTTTCIPSGLLENLSAS